MKAIFTKASVRRKRIPGAVLRNLLNGVATESEGWFDVLLGLSESVKTKQGQTVPSKNTGGDCYQAAFHYMHDNGFDEDGRPVDGILLVHGEVTGQGAIRGIKYGHGWVEDGDTVIPRSNGRHIVMSKRAYYALGKIGQNIHRYTPMEAVRKAVETGIYGPWDLKTESGL
jgi:hypothetical protein